MDEEGWAKQGQTEQHLSQWPPRNPPRETHACTSGPWKAAQAGQGLLGAELGQDRREGRAQQPHQSPRHIEGASLLHQGQGVSATLQGLRPGVLHMDLLYLYNPGIKKQIS